MLEDILIPIVAMLSSFGCTFGIVYIVFSTRHKERMALIEKGADASIFRTVSKPFNGLKWGMLTVGIGIGILLGHIISPFFKWDPQSAYFSMIFLFGGLSLVVYYFIERKQKIRENGENL